MAQRPAPRRHQALDTSRADDKVAEICRQLACANRWRSTWRKRYEATNPAWGQARPTRPQHSPTHTPEQVARAIVSLHVT